MALHFNTETKYGEPVNVTIIRNTFIARILFEGDEDETWFVKEHGNNGVAFPIMETIALESELTIRTDSYTGPDEHEVEEIALDFLHLGESALHYSIAFERDTGWGRVYGPIIGRATTSTPPKVRPWWMQAARNALRP